MAGQISPESLARSLLAEDGVRWTAVFAGVKNIVKSNNINDDTRACLKTWMKGSDPQLLTPLLSCTVLHTITLNSSTHVRNQVASAQVFKRLEKQLHKPQGAPVATALAQLFVDWGYLFSKEDLGMKSKGVLSQSKYNHYNAMLRPSNAVIHMEQELRIGIPPVGPSRGEDFVKWLQQGASPHALSSATSASSHAAGPAAGSTGRSSSNSASHHAPAPNLQPGAPPAFTPHTAAHHCGLMTADVAALASATVTCRTAAHARRASDVLRHMDAAYRCADRCTQWRRQVQEFTQSCEDPALLSQLLTVTDTLNRALEQWQSFAAAEVYTALGMPLPPLPPTTPRTATVSAATSAGGAGGLHGHGRQNAPLGRSSASAGLPVAGGTGGSYAHSIPSVNDLSRPSAPLAHGAAGSGARPAFDIDDLLGGSTSPAATPLWAAAAQTQQQQQQQQQQLPGSVSGGVRLLDVIPTAPAWSPGQAASMPSSNSAVLSKGAISKASVPSQAYSVTSQLASLNPFAELSNGTSAVSQQQGHQTQGPQHQHTTLPPVAISASGMSTASSSYGGSGWAVFDSSQPSSLSNPFAALAGSSSNLGNSTAAPPNFSGASAGTATAAGVRPQGSAGLDPYAALRSGSSGVSGSAAAVLAVGIASAAAAPAVGIASAASDTARINNNSSSLVQGSAANGLGTGSDPRVALGDGRPAGATVTTAWQLSYWPAAPSPSHSPQSEAQGKQGLAVSPTASQPTASSGSGVGNEHSGHAAFLPGSSAWQVDAVPSPNSNAHTPSPTQPHTHSHVASRPYDWQSALGQVLLQVRCVGHNAPTAAAGGNTSSSCGGAVGHGSGTNGMTVVTQARCCACGQLPLEEVLARVQSVFSNMQAAHEVQIANLEAAHREELSSVKARALSKLREVLAQAQPQH